MKFKDIKINDDNNISLSKLCGNKIIKDIYGYFSQESGVMVVINKIIFEDDTYLYCEGEHDFPYVVNGSCKLPNNEILEKLYDEECNI